MGTTNFSFLSRRSYQLGSVICRAFSISNASPNEFRLTECVTQRDEVLHAHGKWPINRTMLIFWLVTLFLIELQMQACVSAGFWGLKRSNGYFRPGRTHLASGASSHNVCFVSLNPGKDKITFHWYVKCLSWQIKRNDVVSWRFCEVFIFIFCNAKHWFRSGLQSVYCESLDLGRDFRECIANHLIQIGTLDQGPV